MEKSLASYMELSCGHMVTREIALLFAAFAPDSKKVYCFNCDRFQPRVKPRKRATYPQDPLF